MSKLLLMLAFVSSSVIAAPTADTKGVELSNALRDSKPCWVSNWGATTTVYHTIGLRQKVVVVIQDNDRVGEPRLNTIIKQCYKEVS